MGEISKKVIERLEEFADKSGFKSIDEAVNFLLINGVSLREALTFDDVTLQTGYADFLPPEEVDITTRITRELKQPTPMISAAMDTITESLMGIAFSELGGSGVIHRSLSIDEQVREVKKVKYAWNLVIQNPRTLSIDQTKMDVQKEIERFDIKGFPVLEDEYLVGIITEKDMKYFSDINTPVKEMMVPQDKLIYIEWNENFTQQNYFDRAKDIMKQHKIDKLPVVKRIDSRFLLKGLITQQDIKKREMYKNASLVDGKTLLVGAAIGAKMGEDGDDIDRANELLTRGKVDYIVIDSSHGASKNVLDIAKELKGITNITKELKDKYEGNIQLIVGNICNPDHVQMLIEAGADALKVGVGPGSTCLTREKTGVGIPQLTATYEVAMAAKLYGDDIPIITDGGLEKPGHVTKAIRAGADAIMTGFLVKATKETPGEVFTGKDGKLVKNYRGMGSLEAMQKGSADRYHLDTILIESWLLSQGIIDRPLEQGVSVEIPYAGPVAIPFMEMVNGLKYGMGLTGCKTINKLKDLYGFYKNFRKVTPVGTKEGGVHGL